MRTLVRSLALLPALVVAQETRISGRIIETNGVPVVDAEVLLKNDPRIGRSARDGSYELRLDKGGSFTVQVRRIGYAPAERKVKVADGERVVVDFTLERRPYALAEVVVTAAETGLSGVVRDDAGAPIADAEAWLVGQDAKVKTDANGMFRLPVAQTGNFLLSVRKAGYAPARVGISLTANTGRRASITMGAVDGKFTGRALADRSGFGRMERALSEFDRRLGWRGAMAVVVTREQLAMLGDMNLGRAVCQLPDVIAKLNLFCDANGVRM
ncbi:MAG: carboxypeptidase regulatory-like domain-containing protein, partial [Gemmatimonadaceae bacterium]|nr:carboxypeptidase regulatory-like domain-containing protein [Gemmatimonadaceae bacterium]